MIESSGQFLVLILLDRVDQSLTLGTLSSLCFQDTNFLIHLVSHWSLLSVLLAGSLSSFSSKCYSTDSSLRLPFTYPLDRLVLYTKHIHTKRYTHKWLPKFYLTPRPLYFILNYTFYISTWLSTRYPRSCVAGLNSWYTCQIYYSHTVFFSLIVNGNLFQLLRSELLEVSLTCFSNMPNLVCQKTHWLDLQNMCSVWPCLIVSTETLSSLLPCVIAVL